MKKNSAKIILLVLLSSFIILNFPSLAKAFDQRAGNFRLKFSGPGSWFSKDQVFAPGETKKKEFWVYNYGQKEEPLYFIAFGQGKDSRLAKNLIVNFYQGSKHILKKRLADLRSSSYNQEILGLINPGQAQKYTCAVYLKKELGNNYQGLKAGPVTFVLGYGNYGSKPEVVIPVFGRPAAGTRREIKAEVKGEKESPGKPEGIKLGEPKNGEVQGDEKTAASHCGMIDWLIIILIIAILALIVWRYLIQRRREENNQ